MAHDGASGNALLSTEVWMKVTTAESRHFHSHDCIQIAVKDRIGQVLGRNLLHTGKASCFHDFFLSEEVEWTKRTRRVDAGLDYNGSWVSQTKTSQGLLSLKLGESRMEML
jgi:hypothetical protein